MPVDVLRIAFQDAKSLQIHFRFLDGFQDFLLRFVTTTAEFLESFFELFLSGFEAGLARFSKSVSGLVQGLSCQGLGRRERDFYTRTSHLTHKLCCPVLISLERYEMSFQ